MAWGAEKRTRANLANADGPWAGALRSVAATTYAIWETAGASTWEPQRTAIGQSSALLAGVMARNALRNWTMARGAEKRTRANRANADGPQAGAIRSVAATTYAI